MSFYSYTIANNVDDIRNSESKSNNDEDKTPELKLDFLGVTTLQSKGLGSNSGEKMPSRHGGTLNNRRAANPIVRVGREERWKALDHLQGVLPQNWDGTEQNCIVT
ncbi:hypothetical protein TNCV_2811521 [Trichonephila clavipes]|nr:hypothetical protein TNCV_2811521 [Trichonephila clavipes]